MPRAISRNFKSTFILKSINFLFYAVIALFSSILLKIAYKGLYSTSQVFMAGDIDADFFNAFLKSLELVLITGLYAIPWGILLGIYLSEFPSGLVHFLIEKIINALNTVPSLVIGLLVYLFLVRNMKTNYFLTSSLTLALLGMPFVAANIKNMLNHSHLLEEAGLALGLSRFQVTRLIIFNNSRRTFVSIVILCLAKLMGEAAALMFITTSIKSDFETLPTYIYKQTNRLGESVLAEEKAWAASFILIILMLSVNVSVKLILRRKA